MGTKGLKIYLELTSNFELDIGRAPERLKHA
jgi:hypothetical protein